MLYLCVLHYEHIAEDSVQEAALSFGAAHAAFRYNYVAPFSQASNRYSGPADKSVILNLFVKSIFPFDVKYARYHPFNIVGQAGQNVCVISFVESLHVALHSLFILAHSLALL